MTNRDGERSTVGVGSTTHLFDAVDPAGLAVFRIAFGLILTWELVTSVLSGSAQEIFGGERFHFTYHGFAWVKAPPFGVESLFLATAAAAFLLALGLWQRLAAFLFTVGFAWIFFLEKARYLNHFYLILLLGGLFVCVPASGAFGLARRPAASPVWGLMLLRAQIGIVYLYAAFAKMNGDWLRAAPLRDWLPARADHPFLGPLVALPAAAWVFSYGGLLLDLLAWPALVCRRTRMPAFALITAFHLTNSMLFGIGVFPWTMIAATTLFFEPDWPRRFLPRALTRRTLEARVPGRRRRALIVGALGAYLAFQVLYPLRHFLYPGSPNWNEEGHRFAWHMKLRDKEGELRYKVLDKENLEFVVVNPAEELTRRQYRKMTGNPGMILEYAHHLAHRYAQRFGKDQPRRIAVHAQSLAGLNGRPFQTFIDPAVDLVGERRGFHRYEWIKPLTVPLPAR